MRILSGQFTVAKWEENSIVSRPEPQKLNEAAIEYTLTGDLTGTLRGKYLMAYQSDAVATYVGILIFEGSSKGKTGQFAINEQGVFKNGVATTHWEVIAGSGTDDFANVRGKGGYAATDGVVDYRFEIDGL